MHMYSRYFQLVYFWSHESKEKDRSTEHNDGSWVAPYLPVVIDSGWMAFSCGWSTEVVTSVWRRWSFLSSTSWDCPYLWGVRYFKEGAPALASLVVESSLEECLRLYSLLLEGSWRMLLSLKEIRNNESCLLCISLCHRLFYVTPCYWRSRFPLFSLFC